MIRKILSSYRAIDPGRKIKRLVLGVSGGADSVALLIAFAELQKAMGVELVVGHLNHRTRGKESDGDASFVRKMCRELGVKCVVKAVDVPALASRKGISLEMAAREVRYECFVELARKKRSSAIVTAHTKDDQAETVILKLARGAGLKGLAGIPSAGLADGVDLFRPMLGISRSEIVAVLRRKGVAWREDASNADQSYLRNRVRAKVLPLLAATLNPDIHEVLARTSAVLREDDNLIEILAEEAFASCKRGKSLDLVGLKQEHNSLVRRVLLMWLVGCGIEQNEVDVGLISEIEKLIKGRKANASSDVAGGFRVVREYDVLSCVNSGRTLPESFCHELRVPGKVRIASVGLIVEAEETEGIIRERGLPGRYPARATVSRKAVGRKKLLVRSVKDGDRIRPMGMTGTRKLKDVFIDLKIPVTARSRIPVVECCGEIIWVPGYRVARGWAVEEGAESLVISVEEA